MNQTTESSESLISLILSGGVASTIIMLLLLLFLIITFYVGIERFLTYRSVLKELSGTESAMINELSQRARLVYSKTNSPEKTEKALEQMAGGYVFELERNTSILATFSGAAPMLGFLGTVIGMIVAIHEIANAGGQIDIKMLSDGLYTAMTTTVAGLIVGIIAYVAYNHLVVRTDKVVYQMEAKSVEFLDLLNEPI